MASLPEPHAGTPCDLRLRDVTTAGGRRATIDILGDRVAALRDPDAPLPPAGHTIDLGGALVLPGLSDGHVHLDKCLLGVDWRPHRVQGSVRALIADEKAFRRTTRVPLAEQGAEALLERMIRGGTTSLRTHVDIDDVTRLDHLAQILDLRARWSDRLQIQIVAFPQSGILGCPSVAGDLDAALRMGADLVGGLDPVGIDGDPDGPLDIVFSLAERHGRGIDIHLHDGGAAGLDTITAIAARTEAAGLGGQVTISHAFALAEAGDLQLGRIAEGLNRAGVAILSSVPGGRRCPPIPRLQELGVAVCFGTDNVRDCWNPATVTSMVDRAQLAADRFDLRTDADLAALLEPITAVPARVLGLGPGVVAPGARADLIAFDAASVPQVIVERQAPVLVVAQGAVAVDRRAAGTVPPP